MRRVLQLTAAGATLWCPLSYYQNPYSVSLLYTPNADASGITAKVQHTMDDPQAARPVTSLTRSGTTATVSDPGHGLATGDCLIVMNSGDANLDSSAGVDVTVVDKDTYTYAVANTGAAAGSYNTRVVTLRAQDHPLMTGMSARTDGNYAFPVWACRLRSTAYTSGGAALTITQAAGRV